MSKLIAQRKTKEKKILKVIKRWARGSVRIRLSYHTPPSPVSTYEQNLLL